MIKTSGHTKFYNRWIDAYQMDRCRQISFVGWMKTDIFFGLPQAGLTTDGQTDGQKDRFIDHSINVLFNLISASVAEKS